MDGKQHKAREPSNLVPRALSFENGRGGKGPGNKIVLLEVMQRGRSHHHGDGLLGAVIHDRITRDLEFP